MYFWVERARSLGSHPSHQSVRLPCAAIIAVALGMGVAGCRDDRAPSILESAPRPATSERAASASGLSADTLQSVPPSGAATVSARGLSADAHQSVPPSGAATAVDGKAPGLSSDDASAPTEPVDAPQTAGRTGNKAYLRALAQARLHMTRKQYPQAVERFQEAVARDPSQAQALAELAHALLLSPTGGLEQMHTVSSVARAQLGAQDSKSGLLAQILYNEGLAFAREAEFRSATPEQKVLAALQAKRYFARSYELSATKAAAAKKGNAPACTVIVREGGTIKKRGWLEIYAELMRQTELDIDKPPRTNEDAAKFCCWDAPEAMGAPPTQRDDCPPHEPYLVQMSAHPGGQSGDWIAPLSPTHAATAPYFTGSGHCGGAGGTSPIYSQGLDKQRDLVLYRADVAEQFAVYLPGEDIASECLTGVEIATISVLHGPSGRQRAFVGVESGHRLDIDAATNTVSVTGLGCNERIHFD